MCCLPQLVVCLGETPRPPPPVTESWSTGCRASGSKWDSGGRAAMEGGPAGIVPGCSCYFATRTLVLENPKTPLCNTSERSVRDVVCMLCSVFAEVFTGVYPARCARIASLFCEPRTQLAGYTPPAVLA